MRQFSTTMVILSVLFVTFVLMLLATRVQKAIAGAISRVVGLILAAVAVYSVLTGIQLYFGLHAAVSSNVGLGL